MVYAEISHRFPMSLLFETLSQLQQILVAHFISIRWEECHLHWAWKRNGTDTLLHSLWRGSKCGLWKVLYGLKQFSDVIDEFGTQWCHCSHHVVSQCSNRIHPLGGLCWWYRNFLMISGNDHEGNKQLKAPNLFYN